MINLKIQKCGARDWGNERLIRRIGPSAADEGLEYKGTPLIFDALGSQLEWLHSL